MITTIIENESVLDDRLSILTDFAITDLYKSFHHSQGDNILQAYLFAYLARDYKSTLQIDDPIDLSSLHDNVLESVKKFTIPAMHTSRDPFRGVELTQEFTQIMDAGFLDQFKIFMSTLDAALNGTSKLDSSISIQNKIIQKMALETDKLIPRIANRMIVSDIYYQRTARPARKENQDNHSSHLQLFLSRKEPLSNPRYKRLYTNIENFLKKGEHAISNNSANASDYIDLVQKYAELKVLWMANHPNEKFI